MRIQDGRNKQAQDDAVMRFAILGSYKSWHVQDLMRAAADIDVTIQCISYDALAAALGSSASLQPCDEFDAVIVRSMPKGALEQIIFRMDVLGEMHGAGKLVLNAPRSLEIAIDKYLGLARLQSVGLRVPQTIVCQTESAAMAAFQSLGGDVVLKPLFGSEGRGIIRATDRSCALEAIRRQLESEGLVYIQRYVKNEGCDYRLLVIGDQVLGMKRSNAKDWRHNVKQGAKATAIEVTEDQAAQALSASRAVGATFAGVDLLTDVDGQSFVLEVNAVPGWRALGRVTGHDVAALFLREVRHLASPAMRRLGVGSPAMLQRLKVGRPFSQSRSSKDTPSKLA